jgi:hypothetical protein
VSSSDVASSKFFHRTQSGSGRSSSSSYGEDLSAPPVPPAVPTLPLGKHIVPPKELYKLDTGAPAAGSQDDKKLLVKPMAFFGTQNIRMPEDWTIVATPAEELPPSLPHPPRRLPSAPAKQQSNRHSQTPSIPEFSIAAPINTFRKRAPSDIPRVESMLGALAPRRMSTSSSRDSDSITRKSSNATGVTSLTSLASTARQTRAQQRSASQHSVPPTVAPRSASLPRTTEPLTFRDMSEKAVLSEQEKAQRWDDLLERSNRAGGTIHLASEKLASDNMSIRTSRASTDLLKGALPGPFSFRMLTFLRRLLNLRRYDYDPDGYDDDTP